jgi:hypothetical protein
MPVRKHRLEDDWTGKKNTRERVGKPLTKLGKEARKMLAESKKKRNKNNKQRGKMLEKEVAQIVHGKKIPMSGAAVGFKGDVEMPIPGRYSTILIECKSRQNNNRVGIDTKSWLHKMELDAACYQSAVTAALVFRFMGDKQYYYMFIPVDGLKRLNEHLGPGALGDQFIDIPEELWYDATAKPNGQPRAIANFPRITVNKEFDNGEVLRVRMAEWAIDKNGNSTHQCLGGKDYILMSLHGFVELLYHHLGEIEPD